MKKIYGDYLLINQSISSIPNFIDKKFVGTNIEYQLTEKLIDFNEIAIVLGNDPLLIRNQNKLKRNFSPITKSFCHYKNNCLLPI